MSVVDKLKTMNVEVAARYLLGKKLVHEGPQGTLSGQIVETEAYHETDPAAHTHRGPTPRNQVMFGPAGHAYIYFSYGNHYCFNVTAEAEGVGAGILVRALEPLTGIAEMQRNRNQTALQDLCSGPGKLTQALGIDKTYYGHALDTAPLYLAPGVKVPAAQIETTARIGISRSQAAPLRFYIKDSSFVSRH